MTLALYRKYRPQTFSELISQEHIKNTLERQVALNKVAHAYLFSGPRGTGKTSTARILTKAINCQKRKKDDGNPCNECESCAIITSGRALDVIEIDAASYTGVDTVRETIVETVKFAPSSSKYKTFIIDEAHMLSSSAWNALLKTLEEPPAHVIFILATTEAHKVPATIASRCQQFDFHRVSSEDLKERLKYIAEQEKIKIKDSVLETVSRITQGCVRDAEGILGQLFALGEKYIDDDVASLILPKNSFGLTIEFIEYLASKKMKQGLELVGGLVDNGFDLDQFAMDALGILRGVLLLKAGGDPVIFAKIDKEACNRLENLAKQLELSEVLLMIDWVAKAKQGLKTASIAQLPFEIATVEVCQRGGSSSHTSNKVPEINNPPPYKELKTSKDIEKIVPKEEVKVIVEEVTPIQVTAIDPGEELCLDDVKARWGEVLDQTQKDNPALAFLLSTSLPMSVEKNLVNIGVQYPFHCSRINDPKCQTVLEAIANVVFQRPVRVKAVVAERIKDPVDALESDVINILGGQAVI